MVIYKTINTVNGKIYVGQDTKNNPSYYGSGKLIRLAIKKYGKHSFKKEILEVCKDKHALDEREKYWIEELNCRNPEIGYNIAKGGEGQNLDLGKEFISKIHKGKKVSQKTIEKIKKAKEGKPISQNSIDALLKAKGHRKGSKQSEEAKLAISLANKNKVPWNKGIPPSEETREKMREAKIGSVLSEEHKLKIAEKSRGRKHTEDAKKKIKEYLTGRGKSEETKKKISETLKNKKK